MAINLPSKYFLLYIKIYLIKINYFFIEKWKFTMLKTDIFVETIHVRLNNASLVGQLLIIWDIIVTHLKISNNQSKLLI